MLFIYLGIEHEPKNRAELKLVIRVERSSRLELVEQLDHVELPTDIGSGLMTPCWDVEARRGSSFQKTSRAARLE